MIHKQIKKGPEKFDLMAALFEGKIVTFIVDEAAPKILEATITSVQTENIANQSWNIIGLFQKTHHRFFASYETKKNTGIMTIEN